MSKKKTNLKALIVAILRIALRKTGSTSVHILIGFKVSCLVHEHCREKQETKSISQSAIAPCVSARM